MPVAAPWITETVSKLCYVNGLRRTNHTVAWRTQIRMRIICINVFTWGGLKVREAIKERLGRHGVSATIQRLDIAEILFAAPQHMSAEQIIAELKMTGKNVSKATVYNTLNMFVAQGLLREVHVDPERTFYDSTTAPHHHFYNVDTGQLTDIPANEITLERLPEVPFGTVAEGVDIVVKVRNAT